MNFDVPISKLENLANLINSKGFEAGYTPKDGKLLPGALVSPSRKSEASRRYFKSIILEAFDISTDEYPENDDYGFLLLGQVLRRAGHDPDTEAAVSVAMNPLNRLESASKPEIATSQSAGAEMGRLVNSEESIGSTESQDKLISYRNSTPWNQLLLPP